MKTLRQYSKAFKYLVHYMILVIKAYILAFLFTHFLLLPVYVSGQSMEPMIREGTVGFSNIAMRHIQGIERFDIVLIQRDNGEIWVKRVIALPNETIEVKNHILYINGIAQEETYLSDSQITADFPMTVVEAHHVFVMGDNRSDSYDSRMVGTIAEDDIIGKDLYAVSLSYDSTTP